MSRIVTRIEEISSARYRIYLEDQFAFVLYRGELSSLHIQENTVLSEELYRYILDEILTKRARKRCLHLLQKRSYTRTRLLGKLREGGYPEAVAAQAIIWVEGFGYVDDFQYACQYITAHMEQKSRRWLTENLRQKGIDSQTLERAWAACCDSEEEQQQREMEQIHRLLRKKGYDGTEQGSPAGREREKLYLYLMRRGFSGDLIARALG